MRVRIISGQFGGRFINTPPGKSTHPMSERARGGIFNSLGDLVPDARALDAFAGSGAVGLEALSRGAKHVTFIEKHRVAGKIIKENCTSLGVEDSSDVIITTVNNWLETADPGEFDLIFADPPYHDLQLSTVKKLMGLLKVGGTMVLSHTGRGGLPEQTGIVVVDNRSYSNMQASFYRRVE